MMYAKLGPSMRTFQIRAHPYVLIGVVGVDPFHQAVSCETLWSFDDGVRILSRRWNTPVNPVATSLTINTVTSPFIA